MDTPVATDDDLDLDDLDLDDDTPGVDPDASVEAPEPAAEAEPPAAPAEPAPAAPAISAETLASLNAVKDAWADLAKAQGYALAEYGDLGITGIDGEAREAFIASAKESHEAKIVELGKLGFKYDPDGTAADEADAAAAAAWGSPIGGGSGLRNGSDEKIAKQVEDVMPQGPLEVAKVLLDKAGLGKFIATGRNV